MNLPSGSSTRRCILSESFQMPNAAGEINVRQYWQAGRQAGTIFDQVDGERTDSRSKGETPQMAIESVNIEPPLRSFDHLRRRRRKLIQWRLGFQVRQTFRAENIKKEQRACLDRRDANLLILMSLRRCDERGMLFPCPLTRTCSF